MLGSKILLLINFSGFCIRIEECFFGLSQDDICWLALQLAKQNGVKNYTETKSDIWEESGLKIPKSKF
jgi:hypothetical protein